MQDNPTYNSPTWIKFSERYLTNFDSEISRKVEACF